MKRPISPDSDDSITYHYVDGQSVSLDELFTTYGDVILPRLIQILTFQQVAQILEWNRAASQWIERYNIWMRLFRRDFPDAFRIHFVGPTSMTYAAMQFLDSVSENPGRKYWKRYYEYLTRLVLLISAKVDLLQIEQRVMNIGRARIIMRRPAVGDNTLAYLHGSYDYSRLNSLAPIHPDRKTALSIVRHNSHMIRVYLDDSGIQFGRIPYNEELLGSKYRNISTSIQGGITNDGFKRIEYSSITGILSLYSTQKRLVSCQVCGSIDNLAYCSCCKCAIYCGVECQRKDWKNHITL